MRFQNIAAFAGFCLTAAGTYCPLLRLFGITNQNLFDVNKPFGLVILLTCTVGLTLLSAGRWRSAQMAARILLALVIVLYAGAHLKVHTTFSGVPYKAIGGYLAGQVKFIWGWYILFAGSIISVLTTSFSKKRIAR